MADGKSDGGYFAGVKNSADLPPVHHFPSFPRRRESKFCSAITKFANIAQPWIPAFAGTTGFEKWWNVARPWIPAYAGTTGFEKWWMKRMMAGISIEQKNDGLDFESVKNMRVL